MWLYLMQKTMGEPFFSSPELKTQVSFSDRLSSVCLSVCLSVRPSVCPSVCKFLLFLTIFSLTTRPISITHGRKHSWVQGIQVCTNEGPRPFPRGDYFEIVKTHWWKLKIFSRTTEPISTKLGTKHPWVKGIQVYSNEGPALFQGEIITK